MWGKVSELHRDSNLLQCDTLLLLIVSYYSNVNALLQNVSLIISTKNRYMKE